MNSEQEFLKVIGNALCRMRQGQKLSQVEVAARLGVSHATISRIECGVTMPIRRIVEYADAIGYRCVMRFEPKG